MMILIGITPAKALSDLSLASYALSFTFKEIFENFFVGILLLRKDPFEKANFIECETVN